MLYRTYVTDSLYLASQQKRMGKRWYDVVRPKVRERFDPAAVLDDVVKRGGLVIE